MKSDKLRKSANGQDCTMRVANVCNYNPETTVLAHINTEGGCMGGKSSDIGSAVYSCYSCHIWLDQNKGSNEDRLFYTRRAIVRTIHRMYDKGIISVM